MAEKRAEKYQIHEDVKIHVKMEDFDFRGKGPARNSPC